MIRFQGLITEIKMAELRMGGSVDRKIKDCKVGTFTTYENSGNKLFSFYVCSTLLNEKFALFSYDNESELVNINTLIADYTSFFGQTSNLFPIQDNNIVINNLLHCSNSCQNTTIDANYDIIEKESVLQLAHNMPTDHYFVAASDKALREFKDKECALKYYNILKEAIETIIR